MPHLSAMQRTRYQSRLEDALDAFIRLSWQGYQAARKRHDREDTLLWARELDVLFGLRRSALVLSGYEHPSRTRARMRDLYPENNVEAWR